MTKYKIKVNIPGWYTKRGIENIGVAKIPRTKSLRFIYDALAEFEESILSSVLQNMEKDKVQKRVKLSEIKNIHDVSGIKSIRKIRRMVESIDDDRHIIARSGMPNIKIFRARNQALYLFDGHHSLLAYMSTNRKYLHQIPYVMIENKDEQRLLDDNFQQFFGGHLKWKRREKWKNFTVNWQARGKKKLCEREQDNMGELFTVVRSRYKI